MQDTKRSDQISHQTSDQRLSSAPIAAEVEFLLARARTIGIVEANAALADFDIKVRHYVVLSLAASPLQPSQRELAEFLHLDPSQIVATIDQLESRGWVARTPSSADRRIKVLHATPTGLAVHEKIKEAVVAAEDRSLSSLSAEERETLKQLLHRISFT